MFISVCKEQLISMDHSTGTTAYAEVREDVLRSSVYLGYECQDQEASSCAKTRQTFHQLAHSCQGECAASNKRVSYPACHISKDS